LICTVAPLQNLFESTARARRRARAASTCLFNESSCLRPVEGRPRLIGFLLRRDIALRELLRAGMGRAAR
jgi:hypothetical protein